MCHLVRHSKWIHTYIHIYLLNTKVFKWLGIYRVNIRIWYNVKICLDQGIWQIFQKLMFNGFLSRGNLCLINHLGPFLPYAASTASDGLWQPLTASKALFSQKNPDPDGLIITGTKITNTGHFLWNGSSKIQFFTNIWHPFWWRPLRPCEVKKVSNSGSGINVHYSGTHWASVFGRFVKTSGRARYLLYLNS